MNYPKCRFDNREGGKFFKKRGTKLETACPSYGNLSEKDSIFCGECGYNLNLLSEPIPKDLSFDEKLDRIQRYLPKGLTAKIFSQSDRIEGERKQITVMFCDVEGLTQFTEKLGPEEACGIMDKIYETLIHRVHDYEGTVNEMTGDVIMALFDVSAERGLAPFVGKERELELLLDGFERATEGRRQAFPSCLRQG